MKDRTFALKIQKLKKSIDIINKDFEDLYSTEFFCCDECKKKISAKNICYYSNTDPQQTEESDIVILCKECLEMKW